MGLINFGAFGIGVDRVVLIMTTVWVLVKKCVLGRLYIPRITLTGILFFCFIITLQICFIPFVEVLALDGVVVKKMQPVVNFGYIIKLLEFLFLFLSLIAIRDLFSQQRAKEYAIVHDDAIADD
jgi:uncharacterized membrane protein